MPVSLIEAALLGRPAVTTDVGSAAEVVADGVTGLVVAKDASAVADAVVVLLRDPRRREVMGAAARRRAQDLFSADRLVADTTALYEALVSR
jgi:glycosyltransferase involved in cell wall biosynthesis